MSTSLDQIRKKKVALVHRWLKPLYFKVVGLHKTTKQCISLIGLAYYINICPYERQIYGTNKKFLDNIGYPTLLRNRNC